MKKELLIASLMLTSPTALALDYAGHDLSEAIAVAPPLEKAEWVFQAENYIRLPRYTYEPETGDSVFSYYDTLQVSVHFFPVDSSSELFDFKLKGFDPIKNGEQEFEIAFETQNITNQTSYFEGDKTYYGIKRGDAIHLFDCDSTKRCDASPESKSFATIKIKKDGSMKFVNKADFFNTPYTTYNSQTERFTDLGAELKYSLIK